MNIFALSVPHLSLTISGAWMIYVARGDYLALYLFIFLDFVLYFVPAKGYVPTSMLFQSSVARAFYFGIICAFSSAVLGDYNKAGAAAYYYLFDGSALDGEHEVVRGNISIMFIISSFFLCFYIRRWGGNIISPERASTLVSSSLMLSFFAVYFLFSPSSANSKFEFLRNNIYIYAGLAGFCSFFSSLPTFLLLPRGGGK